MQPRLQFGTHQCGTLQADLDGAMSAFFEPIDQFRDLRRAARSVRAFDHNQLSGQFIDINARNSVAVKPALARSRD